MWAKQAIGLVEGIGQSARARHAAAHTSNMAVDFPTLGNLCERSVPICEVPEMAMGRVHAESHAALAPARSGAPPSRPRSRFASRQRVSLDMIFYSGLDS